MNILSGKVADTSASRDRMSRPKWQGESEDFNLEDFAPIIQSMLKSFVLNQGKFKIGGDVSVEYQPKRESVNPNMLMTTETAFFFHAARDEGSVTHAQGVKSYQA